MHESVEGIAANPARRVGRFCGGGDLRQAAPLQSYRVLTQKEEFERKTATTDVDAVAIK